MMPMNRTKQQSSTLRLLVTVTLTGKNRHAYQTCNHSTLTNRHNGLSSTIRKTPGQLGLSPLMDRSYGILSLSNAAMTGKHMHAMVSLNGTSTPLDVYMRLGSEAAHIDLNHPLLH